MTATRPALAGFAGVVPFAARPGSDFPRERSVESLPGVGPRVAERLAGLGIRTLGDLVEYVPRDHLDWSQATGFASLRIGEEATVACTVERARVRPTRRRNLRLVEAAVADERGGRATAVWFNQAWLGERLRPGTRLLVHGELGPGGAFRVARHEFDGEGAGLHTVGLVAVYPASEAVSTARLRELTEAVLPLARWLPDPLPTRIRERDGLPLRGDALVALHRPRHRTEIELARRRLALEELLVLLTGLARRRRAADEGARAEPLREPGELAARLRAALPFELTPEQEAAIAAIDADLAGDTPMQRLLQGDVGSGKTVVALYALLRAVERGHQGALMAPTETLAEQHFLTIEELTRALGVRTVLLTSSLPAKAHAAAREAVASGEASLVVGTHALI
ncbi:MAG: DEAD/DEAH box helicase, partial [Actinomycetota bacterium]|nr:DEAD/DEAH box helicase [Actinomycetota bacterium]